MLRFVLGVPALLVALAYFLPGARMRRQIKADAEVVAALPRGELRDRFQERVNGTAQRLLRYRVYIVDGNIYWLNWIVVAFWAVGTVYLMVDFPTRIVAAWEAREWLTGFGLLFGLFGVIWLLMGRDIHGRSPDSIRAEEISLVASVMEAKQAQARAEEARRERDSELREP